MANAACIVDGHFDKVNRMRLMSLFVCVCYVAQMRAATDISHRIQQHLVSTHPCAQKNKKRGYVGTIQKTIVAPAPDI